MNIGGRWVSLEFANALFGFWIVEVALLVALAWWLSKRGGPAKPTKGAGDKRRSGKRPRQAKRKS